MLDLCGLQQHEGELIHFVFAGGEVVQAKLLGVDTVEHDDVMFEVSGNFYVASLSELVSWSAVEQKPYG